MWVFKLIDSSSGLIWDYVFFLKVVIGVCRLHLFVGSKRVRGFVGIGVWEVGLLRVLL